MEAYKREFIQFLQSAGVLKFGDFTAKSGRKIPYFVNAGMIKTGDQITKMGEFYAKAYFEKLGKKQVAQMKKSHFSVILQCVVTMELASSMVQSLTCQNVSQMAMTFVLSVITSNT